MSKNKNWKQAIDKPRFHVNGDGSVRAEPDSLLADNKITITEEYDIIDKSFKQILIKIMI